MNIGVEELLNIKQIVIELHGVNDDSWGTTLTNKLNCLKKINSTHYLIHAHGNNNGGTTLVKNRPIPDVIELTFIRKDTLTKIEPNITILPIKNLDYPNKNDIHDIDLNFYPFVANK